jgi:hypothetical protein
MRRKAWLEPIEITEPMMSFVTPFYHLTMEHVSTSSETRKPGSSNPNIGTVVCVAMQHMAVNPMIEIG